MSFPALFGKQADLQHPSGLQNWNLLPAKSFKFRAMLGATISFICCHIGLCRRSVFQDSSFCSR